MITGLVLVKLKTGQETDTLEKIKSVEGVAHVSAVFGRWDLVLDIESEDLPTLSNVVVGKIRSIEGVETTETLVTTAL